MSTSRVKTHKLVLIGDPAVGKTSLRKRYLGEGFKANYAVTIGADFGVKRITQNGASFLFQIWDLSGQISFHSVRKLYYNNVTSLLIVFDLSNKASLANVISWFDEYKANNFDSKISCVLIGNKQDLIDDIEPEIKMEIEKCRAYIDGQIQSESRFFTTSALSGLNVEEAFSWIIDSIIGNGK